MDGYVCIAIVFLAIYVLPIILFHFSSRFRRFTILWNYINIPFCRYYEPQYYGLRKTKVFFTKSTDNNRLGTWHIYPGSLSYIPDIENEGPEGSFNDTRPVIIYLHGSVGNRIFPFRVKLYKILAYSSIDSHVITFDYRGYGDSTSNHVTIRGLVDDARSVYLFILRRVNKNAKRIAIYGHSLGTGIATRFISELSPEHQPRFLLLEAPYTSISEAFLTHPMTRVYKILPYLYLLQQGLQDPDISILNAENNLANICCPILIFHAKEDGVIPLFFSRRILDHAKDIGKTDDDIYLHISMDENTGHSNFYLRPEVPLIISELFASKNIQFPPKVLKNMKETPQLNIRETLQLEAKSSSHRYIK